MIVRGPLEQRKWYLFFVWNCINLSSQISKTLNIGKLGQSQMCLFLNKRERSNDTISECSNKSILG